MVKLLLSILLAYFSATVSFAQHHPQNDFGKDLLEQADNSFCNGDTLQTVKILAHYIDQFPDLGTTLLISKRLAELYLAIDKTELAIALLEKAIKIIPKKGFFVYKGHCNLFTGIDADAAKAELCVLLSRIYTSLSEYDNALDRLILADTEYLPFYGGCANGMIMYKTKLSLDFADYYLYIGDTTKAVDRLFAYFLSGENYSIEVTAELKSILLQSLTQEQITADIHNGLETMYLTENQENEHNDVLTMAFFGRTLKTTAYGDLVTCKNYYRSNESIRMLLHD